ncbi:hypothetical protein Desti_2894 [Desulfomonile tiedjei DSM 6799]|uniref:Uncharacterized protein n=1 Tax=Desulfomonile tiedjei (strain ATCC 49306 / DSM 6799 / DCB-1) TaxID=706587 RepID=I4C7M2_DESTA|nr:hypothetical protein Desti_2894 [Desulfomonile tiedjei DSM 6799]
MSYAGEAYPRSLKECRCSSLGRLHSFDVVFIWGQDAPIRFGMLSRGLPSLRSYSSIRIVFARFSLTEVTAFVIVECLISCGRQKIQRFRALKGAPSYSPQISVAIDAQ